MTNRLLRLAIAAAFCTTALSLTIPDKELADGHAFGFELKDTILANGTTITKWAPSQAMLDEQAARMETLYILDPITNKTIPNPNQQEASLSKRGQDFNFDAGAECRMVFEHHDNVQACCLGLKCSPCSFETKEFRIVDNKNSDWTYVVFNMKNPNDWEYYQLNGHRGWWGIANWGVEKWYAIDSAYGHIEGAPTDRDMKYGDYCWYSQGSAWWGYWGEAACTSWCSDFNW